MRTAPQSSSNDRIALDRVVHIVLDRMRRHLVAHVLFHAECYVGVDQVVVQHAAGFQEAAILVEVV